MPSSKRRFIFLRPFFPLDDLFRPPPVTMLLWLNGTSLRALFFCRILSLIWSSRIGPGFGCVITPITVSFCRIARSSRYPSFSSSRVVFSLFHSIVYSFPSVPNRPFMRCYSRSNRRSPFLPFYYHLVCPHSPSLLQACWMKAKPPRNMILVPSCSKPIYLKVSQRLRVRSLPLDQSYLGSEPLLKVRFLSLSCVSMMSLRELHLGAFSRVRLAYRVPPEKFATLASLPLLFPPFFFFRSS